MPYTNRIAVSVLMLVAAAPACPGQRYYAGALGGVATLSSDATANTGAQTAVSLYKPENGAAFNLFGGIHLNDWFSLQGNYVWNHNDLTATEISGGAALIQPLHSSQHAAIADLLLYFRPRRSHIRPYLSVGTGYLWLRTSAAGTGTVVLPPVAAIEAGRIPLRVAVGIDLTIHAGWGFRYSFSETTSANPITVALQPAGGRGLANFQNLFGFVKYF